MPGRMLASTTLHPEGARYSAPLLFLPGLWADPATWRPVASYLAHRGWSGTTVDLRGVRGGMRGRARAVVDFVAALPSPPVLVGHDAGALVALASARSIAAPALVLVAPLVPGTPPTHAFTWSWTLVWATLRRRAAEPPHGTTADAVFADLPPAHRAQLAADDATLVAEIARGRRFDRPVAPPPILLLAGERDPLLPPPDVSRVATELGAETRVIPGAGHWPLVGPGWQTCVDETHRWLVRRLGEPLLDGYADAMAERDAIDDPEE
jgi:pimeloyl-ACP methyl ester carboxylesterase